MAGASLGSNGGGRAPAAIARAAIAVFRDGAGLDAVAEPGAGRADDEPAGSGRGVEGGALLRRRSCDPGRARDDRERPVGGDRREERAELGPDRARADRSVRSDATEAMVA